MLVTWAVLLLVAAEHNKAKETGADDSSDEDTPEDLEGGHAILSSAEFTAELIAIFLSFVFFCIIVFAAIGTAKRTSIDEIWKDSVYAGFLSNDKRNLCAASATFILQNVLVLCLMLAMYKHFRAECDEKRHDDHCRDGMLSPLGYVTRKVLQLFGCEFTPYPFDPSMELGHFVFCIACVPLLTLLILDDIKMAAAAFMHKGYITWFWGLFLPITVVMGNETATRWTFQSGGSYFEAILNSLTFYVILDLDEKLAGLLYKDSDAPADHYESLPATSTQEMTLAGEGRV
jgi:hypothetical protein